MTVAENFLPSRIASAGVITSSSPWTAKPAGRPLTETALTDLPSKSRLNRDSAWVAFASIERVPSTVCTRAAVG